MFLVRFRIEGIARTTKTSREGTLGSRGFQLSEPLPDGAVVLSVVASGAEKEYVLTSTNLRSCSGEQITWRGDDAQFIVDNLVH